MSEKGDTKKIEAALARPFPAEDIEWRVQRSGEKNGKPWAMVLAYVTARAIQERLDEVCGILGWKNVYEKGPDGGVMCGISLADSEGNWITKYDGAENTNIEAVKGGISGAFKRAGSVWRIGRYLYNLEATFAIISDNGSHSDKTKEGKWFKWNPPALPAWALPEGEKPITFDELRDKLMEAKAIPHLQNIWTKHAEAMKGMTEEQKKDLAVLKDLRKDAIGRGEG